MLHLKTYQSLLLIACVPLASSCLLIFTLDSHFHSLIVQGLRSRLSYCCVISEKYMFHFQSPPRMASYFNHTTKKCQGRNKCWYLLPQHPMDTVAFLTVLCIPRTHRLQECNDSFTQCSCVLSRPNAV